jgi:hypothetical protein
MSASSASLLALSTVDRYASAGPARPSGASKHISLHQATNMMQAVAFAREIATPLNAHATIHWIGTNVGDDPDGRRFAQVRECFDKWLLRHQVPGGLTAIWARERLSGGTAEVVHCHLLFHLPPAFQRPKKLAQVTASLRRLVERHGDGIYGDFAVDLRIHSNPDGRYLIKGGGRDVWNRFNIRTEHRRLQGTIHGKRCGTTENIGLAERRRWKEQQDRTRDAA